MKRIAIALGLAAGLGASACAPVTEVSPAAPDVSPKVFTGVIGIAGPMSGPYAAFGEQMQRGAEMAVAHLNGGGGVLGQKLVLEIGDDRCEPRRAVAVANEFVRKGVTFVAGHFCSGSSIPASKLYSEEGIIQISRTGGRFLSL